jgi:hypothetical protein
MISSQLELTCFLYDSTILNQHMTALATALLNLAQVFLGVTLTFAQYAHQV